MAFLACFIDRVKSSIFQLNLQLLKLKATYFLVYAVWMSVFPYLALMSSQIVTFQQMAITFTVIPISSVIGPMVSGFLADKIGNYKMILMGTILLGGTVHLPMLWLMADRRYLERNFSMPLDKFANATLVERNYSQIKEKRDELHPQYDYTFPVLLIMRIFGFFAMDTTNMLLDSCGMAMSKKFEGEFGKQKMFATCSMVVVPLICGVLIDLFSAHQGYKDYSIAFYIALACSVLAAILIYQLDVKVPKQKGSIFRTAKKVVKMVDVDVFMLVQVVVGTCWGVHMNFFSFYVDVDLKASKTLFGAALCISGSISVLMFWVARPIVTKFGEANTMAFGLLCYSGRFIGYYFLTTPWAILITEVMDGLSGFLALVAGNYFCANAAGHGGPLATFSALLFSANFGAGRTLGTTIGSSLLSTQGMRLNYLIFGTLAGCTAVLYMAIYHLVLKKKEKKRLAKPSPFLRNIEGLATAKTEICIIEERMKGNGETEDQVAVRMRNLEADCHQRLNLGISDDAEVIIKPCHNEECDTSVTACRLPMTIDDSDEIYEQERDELENGIENSAFEPEREHDKK